MWCWRHARSQQLNQGVWRQLLVVWVAAGDNWLGGHGTSSLPLFLVVSRIWGCPFAASHCGDAAAGEECPYRPLGPNVWSQGFPK